MDAVASEISLIESSRRCAIHIFTQTRFLEVTLLYIPIMLCITEASDTLKEKQNFKQLKIQQYTNEIGF